jgi:hypothetical protein
LQFFSADVTLSCKLFSSLHRPSKPRTLEFFRNACKNILYMYCSLYHVYF